MKKWIFLFFALVLVFNIGSMGMGCKAKEEPKPAAKEEMKPPETPAPAEPASTPEPAPEKPAEAPSK